jgi:Fic family protein
MEEAIASSQIEGASTTRRVAKDMLREGRPPQDRSERMILNNYRTVSLMREYRDRELTPSLVVEIQAGLTDGTLDDPDDVGRLRQTDDVLVHDAATLEVLHVPPPIEKVPGELVRLCEYANDEGGPFEHPVLRAIVLHFWLAYLHPFADGNGRTARALFYLHMLKSGYWLFEFLSISRVILERRGQYDRAFLYSETDDCDLTYFLAFNLRAIETALGDLWDYLAEKRTEERELERRIADDRALNARQRAVLSKAMREPEARFTIASHQASHDVAYATARADLLELVELGYLEQHTEGRAFVFTRGPGVV